MVESLPAAWECLVPTWAALILVVLGFPCAKTGVVAAASVEVLRKWRREGENPWHDVDQWKRDIDSLSQCDNVICKISGIIARAPKKQWRAEDLAPAIHFCLDAFGPDRVIYGGDWPMCKITASYKDWVMA